MSPILKCWAASRELPTLQRLLCRAGMIFGPLFLVAVLLPIADYQIGSREVSWREFWVSGAGPLFAAVMFLVTVGSWGLAARRSAGRWLLVLTPLVMVATLLLFADLDWTAVDALVLALFAAMTALNYIALFRSPAVRHYLSDAADPA